MDFDNLRKLQLLELKILIEIKRICEKRNIEYILIGGTLLGAIRHKGFIPWDDDIDIGMTRENFDFFCKIAQEELSEEYFFDSPLTNDQCFSKAKVRLKGTRITENKEPNNADHNGFFVDIFSYDNIPNCFLFGCFYWNIYNILIRVFWLRKKYYLSKSIITQLITFLGTVLCLPISTNRLKTILDNYHKKYINCKANYVVLLVGSWGFKKERHLYSTITNIVYVFFENVLLPIPENYHLFLSEQYGDYMTPPPNNSRKIRHINSIDFGIY